MKTLLLALPLLLAGCARLSQSSASAGSEADQNFQRLAQEYTAGYLAWRPQAGTALGLHEYDGKVTDFSPASLQSELARLRSFDQRLAAIKTPSLNPQAYYDYRILHGAVRREIFTFEQMRSYWQNPMTYAGVIDVNIYIKRNFAPLEQRVASIISILNQTPKLMAAARANLAGSLPEPQVETAIEQANGMTDFLGKDLVEALKDISDQKLMASFNEANARAIAELRGYASYLKEQKLPKANASYSLGREKYVKLLTYGEMVTIPPERLLDIGLNELRRQQGAFAEAAKMIDPGKTPLEVFKAIQRDHPTEATLIPDTPKDLEMIRQFLLDKHIITLPSDVRAQVAATPQYLRATTFASMDTPGPFETKATEAYYYVTPPEPGWPQEQKDEWLTSFNYYTTDVVSIHEAYPGHYVQFLCLNASPANRLEKIFTSYAFTEGWAHYTEQMMLDSGFGASQSPTPTHDEQIKAAKYRMAQADEALLRVCRFCVSIKMHCQGMTVDDATRFFQDNCYYEPKPARQEAVRGTFDPEYLYYTLGKLEILKLREDYRAQEGQGFSLQKFHDTMLGHGAPPIRLLREVLLRNPAEWPNVL